ncbi:hypothetical protein [Azospirillum thermophilum]|nr:hypothetical protein [Azospirillum thermophilum]
MEAGTGGDEGLVIEHFGPFDLLFRLAPGCDRLSCFLAVCSASRCRPGAA